MKQFLSRKLVMLGCIITLLSLLTVGSASADTINDLYIIGASTYVDDDCMLHVTIYNAWGTTPIVGGPDGFINLSIRGLDGEDGPRGVNIGWRTEPMVEDEFDEFVWGPITVDGNGPLIVGFTTPGSDLVNSVEVTNIPAHCYEDPPSSNEPQPCIGNNGQSGWTPSQDHPEYDVDGDVCVTFADAFQTWVSCNGDNACADLAYAIYMYSRCGC